MTVVTVIALAGITLFIRGCYIQRYYSVDRYRRERFESHCLVHRINAEPMRLSFTVHPADLPGPFVGGSPSQASKLEQPRWPTGRLAILWSHRSIRTQINATSQAISSIGTQWRQQVASGNKALCSAAIDQETVRIKWVFSMQMSRWRQVKTQKPCLPSIHYVDVKYGIIFNSSILKDSRRMMNVCNRYMPMNVYQ